MGAGRCPSLACLMALGWGAGGPGVMLGIYYEIILV